MRERIEPVGEARRFGPGVGFNWFDYLGMGGSYAHPPEYYPLADGCYPPLEDQASWTLILGELDRLRPGFIRFGIPPDPHVDERGRIVTDTVHLRRLDLVARWAALRGCTILLDTFLLPARYELPRVAGDRLPWDGGMYQLGAADNRAYAREFVAPFLRHVCLERGLEAVRFFNPVNEPMAYGVYQMPEGGPDTYVHYVEMYREMREALDAAGVSRGRLGLVGCDANEPEGWPGPGDDSARRRHRSLRGRLLHPLLPAVLRLPDRQPGAPRGGDHDPRRGRQAHRQDRPLLPGARQAPLGPRDRDLPLRLALGDPRGRRRSRRRSR